MRLFLDSTALAQLFLADAETEHVAEQCAEADEVLYSILAPLEVLDAFSRFKKDGSLSKQQYAALKERVADHAARATVIGITPPVLARSISFVEWGGLTPTQALHVGCALASRPDLFLSADQQQCHRAAGMGLAVGHLRTPRPSASRDPKLWRPTEP